ncbi:MAG: DUF3618 domain-containing protein [Alphaproteobacteria bacterium]|nr:DUF3618 domain-containing protein [Alphaproteobacteria bacterium]
MTNDKPEDYERQLEQDRAAIGETIDAIQRRLSPGQLFEQAVGYARAGSGQAASSIVRSAKQNPWPLVLTGVSLAWLIQSTSSSRSGDRYPAGEGYDYGEDYNYEKYDYVERPAGRERAGESAWERARAASASIQRGAGEAEETFQARVTAARAKAAELKQEAGETAEAFRDRVNDTLARAERRASEFRRRAGSAMDRTKDAVSGQVHTVQTGARNAQRRAKDFYESEPLIVGAVGVVAGALIGALLPSTRAEDRLLGEYGVRVRQSASDMASTAAERAKAAGAEGARAAAEAAEQAVRGDGRTGQDSTAGHA